MAKLFERGAAGESGEGCTGETGMQSYPWEGCQSLLCGLTVAWIRRGGFTIHYSEANIGSSDVCE
eukprot:5931297-Pyramimonas_sp.AAC.1